MNLARCPREAPGAGSGDGWRRLEQPRGRRDPLIGSPLIWHLMAIIAAAHLTAAAASSPARLKAKSSYEYRAITGPPIAAAARGMQRASW